MKYNRDILDTRHLQKRLEELESEKEDNPDDFTDQDELDELLAAREEISEWYHGETLIADNYFEQYARELPEECGDPIPDGWPYDCIDWEDAAEELKQDYGSVELYGTDYWYRYY